MSSFKISGHIIDLHHNRIFPGIITIHEGKIVDISAESIVENQYIMPGFIDAHVHIESSMLIPSEFARLAVAHGTVATVSDPHEIGNVMGIKGIRYMVENSKKVPFHFFFGASSCVPTTNFETAGAAITKDDIETLFRVDNLKYLSEMMNYPGVLQKDPEILEKIALAKLLGKPIDGHAPGLRGQQAREYCEAGISTDHECYSLDEALEKIQYGMKILIREGSAAKNYNALHPLLKSFPHKTMFCHDDLHPNDLVNGHMNLLVKRSINLNYDLLDILRSACLNPVEHYSLDVGTLKKGDSADFIVVNNLYDFNVLATYIGGLCVAEKGRSLIEHIECEPINHFECKPIYLHQLKIRASNDEIHIIKAIPGQLLTHKLVEKGTIFASCYISDPTQDILKLVVVNRYFDAPPAIAFVQGFNLKSGALASSVAHDSHNVIAVGVDDASLCAAINAIIDAKGGIAVAQQEHVDILQLPIAGLMSKDDGYSVAEKYNEIKQKALILGSTLPDPFMTLSFMALLVIPSLKLSDQGLFDSESFKFTSLASDS
jgi:adenine deaminase